MLKNAFRFTCVLALVGSIGYAQDLDTTHITDDFDSGTSRGNNTGSGTWGASARDGSEFEAYNGTDSTGGPINYINTWAGASQTGEVETPIVDFTVAHDNPDRALTGALEAIPANGSSTHGIIVGDDGGHNGLFFGEEDDADYYVEADVYCYTGVADSEIVMVGARAGHLTGTEYSFCTHRDGGYVVQYDANTGEVKAGTYPDDDSKVLAQAGATQNITTAGWHTFRIECEGTQIGFFLDGVEIATITDTTFATGRPGLSYWEAGSLPAADENQGHFDNLKAGPTSTVADWQLF